MDIDTMNEDRNAWNGFENNLSKRHWRGRLLPTCNCTDRSYLLSNMLITFVGFRHCSVCLTYPGFCLFSTQMVWTWQFKLRIWWVVSWTWQFSSFPLLTSMMNLRENREDLPGYGRENPRESATVHGLFVASVRSMGTTYGTTWYYFILQNHCRMGHGSIKYILYI